MKNYQLVLASTSPYRQSLLQKLQIPFSCQAPDCDETPLDNESPQALVQRLAKKKAMSCANLPRHSLVIGSDQVCCFDAKILGKPHTEANAIAQLMDQAGKRVTFYTGLALYNTETQQCQVELDTFHVHFRPLTLEQATRYVKKDQPLNCAGSFKSEGLGIALFERLEGDDPNALVGLPLIRLQRMLEQFGLSAI